MIRPPPVWMITCRARSRARPSDSALVWTRARTRISFFCQPFIVMPPFDAAIHAQTGQRRQRRLVDFAVRRPIALPVLIAVHRALGLLRPRLLHQDNAREAR